MIFLHAPPGTSSVIYGMAETLNSSYDHPCSTVIGIFSFKNVRKYLVSHSEDAVFAQLS